ncbi:tRNA (guanosine(37)-N1)-methyltransferase TrmD [Candidatus Dojkabacteria bacterium]|uniref:tRNA (guanine-N(1)-)-methyltransferase n=1 Tax=Candidatus Dojkabacteria bacterium TaxID=2099670 RepID=A0A5C7J545_9BACT|nr:MAG: tRNA (guanosine(37)-N1)-methyltransferase TrmD [Candidatus Dojkabacteria bacterium]
MKITILTLFPQMFQGPFDYSIIKNAQDQNAVEINYIDIRNFGIGKHKTVDDTPYGGGKGMVLKIDVLKAAIDSAIDKNLSKDEQEIYLMSAKGKVFNQMVAKDLSKLKHLILVCGHYEGVDERILNYINGEISIGEFVLTGGELPAMIIVDAVSRLLPGVLGEEVTDNESHSTLSKLEHPQYTRPEKFEEHSVPEVLKSGNHKLINQWKEENSKSN